MLVGDIAAKDFQCIELAGFRIENTILTSHRFQVINIASDSITIVKLKEGIVSIIPEVHTDFATHGYAPTQLLVRY